jgi:hypothetical protein
MPQSQQGTTSNQPVVATAVAQSQATKTEQQQPNTAVPPALAVTPSTHHAAATSTSGLTPGQVLHEKTVRSNKEVFGELMNRPENEDKTTKQVIAERWYSYLSQQERDEFERRAQDAGQSTSEVQQQEAQQAVAKAQSAFSRVPAHPALNQYVQRVANTPNNGTQPSNHFAKQQSASPALPSASPHGDATAYSGDPLPPPAFEHTNLLNERSWGTSSTGSVGGEEQVKAGDHKTDADMYFAPSSETDKQ